MKWAIKLVLCALAFSMQAQAASGSLVVCYEDTSNPPFYFGTRNQKPELPGVTVELIQLAAQEQGLQLKLLPMQWKSCLAAMTDNTVDAAFDFSFKAKRESFVVYPYKDGKLDQKRYLHELAYYLFTMQDSKLEWDGNKLSDAKSKLAAVAGYSIVSDLQGDGYSVEEGLNQRSNLESLVKGKVDGLAQFASITQSIMRKRPGRYANVKQHKLPLRSKLYYLVFAKKFHAEHGNSAEAIWDSIAKMNADGTTAKLTTKYAE
jgi:polar amino acid transport system substrate-binding protein